MISKMFLLTVSFYFTPADIDRDTPSLAARYFNTMEECVEYKSEIEPQLNVSLEQGLLAYSANCE